MAGHVAGINLSDIATCVGLLGFVLLHEMENHILAHQFCNFSSKTIERRGLFRISFSLSFFLKCTLYWPTYLLAKKYLNVKGYT